MCNSFFSRYHEYRSEYISTPKRAYFNAYKDEEWYVFFSTAEISFDPRNVHFVKCKLASCFTYMHSCNSFLYLM